MVDLYFLLLTCYFWLPIVEEKTDMELNEVIYLDVETTGLNRYGDDEVVEVALVDQDGKTLLNSLVRPVNATEWKRAERVHGISPEMVANAPTLDELKDQIKALITGKHVRIYNAAFDRQFIDLSGAREVSCVMLDYAEFRGIWSDYFDSYAWHKLTEAANYLRLDTDSEQAHRALADAKLTQLVDAEMAKYIESGSLRNGGEKLQEERKVEVSLSWIWNMYDNEKKFGCRMIEDEEIKFLSQLGMRAPKNRANFNLAATCDEYAILFFGKNCAELSKDAQTERLKAEFGERYYTKRNQIAEGLISYTEAFSLCGNEQSVWNDVVDEADGVIETPQTTRYLYDKVALEDRLSKSRLAQLYLRPTGYTRTELKKMKYTDEEIDASPVTGYGKGCRGNSWHLRAMPERKQN